MGRGLIVLLVVSVALNIFALGHVSGRWIGHELPHYRQPPHTDMMRGRENPMSIMRHAHTLPEASREKFRDAIEQGLPEARENFEETRRLRQELSELMNAETWDRDAIAAKMSEIQAQQATQRAAFDAAFLDALETLSPDERKMLFQAQEERRDERRQRFRQRMEERRGPPPEEE